MTSHDPLVVQFLIDSWPIKTVPPASEDTRKIVAQAVASATDLGYLESGGTGRVRGSASARSRGHVKVQNVRVLDKRAPFMQPQLVVRCTITARPALRPSLARLFSSMGHDTDWRRRHGPHYGHAHRNLEARIGEGLRLGGAAVGGMSALEAARLHLDTDGVLVETGVGDGRAGRVVLAVQLAFLVLFSACLLLRHAQEKVIPDGVEPRVGDGATGEAAPILVEEERERAGCSGGENAVPSGGMKVTDRPKDPQIEKVRRNRFKRSPRGRPEAEVEAEVEAEETQFAITEDGDDEMPV
eukprot:g2845.t1